MHDFEADESGTELTDAELLGALRGGNTSAYTELWMRHVRAALRVAGRIAPGHAEDLVSESFLAVFDQIVNAGNGPESSFRAYLFTTMRNTAIRWQKAGRLVDTDPDLDEVVAEDGLWWVSDRESSAEILHAFQGLPERWQRVLWLSEVEDVSREQIAADLNLKPNAVSALLKRAKAGFRLSWLERAVPADLRGDPQHVAGLLPELLMSGRADTLSAAAQQHLVDCERCADANKELRATHQRMRRTTLGTAGLGALGIVFPTVSHAPVAAAAVVATLVSATAIAAGVTLAIATGATIAELPASPQLEIVVAAEASDLHAIAGSAMTLTTPQPSPSALPAPLASPNSPAPTVTPTSPQPGRGVVDETVPVIGLGRGATPTDYYEPPTPVRPVPGGSAPRPTPTSSPIGGGPGTAEPTPIPTAAPLNIELTSPTHTAGYLAPVITGRARPGSSVALEVSRQPDAHSGTPIVKEYVVNVDGAGAWSIDLRAAMPDYYGIFDYQVWAFAGDEISQASDGQYSVSQPVVGGFEDLDPWDPIPLEEAQSTGIVFRTEGPAAGRICVAELTTSYGGEFVLGSDGTALQRIRMLDPGTYWLSIRACEGDYRGPATEVFVDVASPDVGPIGGVFGGGAGDELRFTLSEP